MNRRLIQLFPLFAAIWTTVLAWFWNHDLHGYDTWEKISRMNEDTHFILEGYKLVPNPLIQGWQWWCGPWIEQTVQVLRPIASYLLWFDCWAGPRWGAPVIYAVGFSLFLIVCFLCCGLAWRMTKSRLAVLMAGFLAAEVPYWNYGGQQPREWLVWFPVHHDLLFLVFLLSAVLVFDCWLEYRTKRLLILTWGLFLAGCFTKEYCYVFPALAAVLVATRVPEAEKRHEAWRQVGFMFAVVVALLLYRRAVLPKAYNPPRPKWVHFLRKPYFYWFYPFYKNVLTENYWVPGLAFLLYLSGGGWIRWARSERGRRFAEVPFGGVLPFAVILGAIAVYLYLSTGSVMDCIWFFLDWASWKPRVSDLCGMVGLFYAVHLAFKYRKEEPGLAALLLMMLIYVPVWTYLGWHYCLPGWFVRAGIWWPAVARLVWRDTEDYWKRAWTSLGRGALRTPG